MLLVLEIRAFILICQEKYQLRLRVLEDSLRGSSNIVSRSTSDGRNMSNGPSRRQSLGGADNFSKLTSNGFLSKRSPSSQLRSSLSSSTVLKHAKGTSKSFDGGTRSLDGAKVLLNGTSSNISFNQPSEGTKEGEAPNNEKFNDFLPVDIEDNVPGVLYDLLQKEVIALRKAGHEKDQGLKDKDDAIEVDTCVLSIQHHFNLSFWINALVILVFFRCSLRRWKH